MNIVWLDAQARSHIEREAVKRRLCETGGALFGWESDGALVVACASGPGTRAKHRPRSFEAHRATTAAAMRAVALSSERRYGYLGTWHTHPRGDPSPSGLDSDTASRLAAQADLLLPRPLLLILSTTGQAWNVRPATMRAWRWDPERQCLRPAELLPCHPDERYCPEQPLFGGECAPATDERQSSQLPLAAPISRPGDPTLRAACDDLGPGDFFFDDDGGAEDEREPTPAECLFQALGQLYRHGALNVWSIDFDVWDLGIIGVRSDIEFVSEDQLGAHYHFASEVLQVQERPDSDFPWRLLDVWA